MRRRSSALIAALSTIAALSATPAVAQSGAVYRVPVTGVVELGLAPYIERAPSGRAKCKNCGEPIELDSLRVVLLREIVFGRQVRGTPINVHPGCVAAELRAEDCLTEIDGFEEAVHANSRDTDPADIVAGLEAIGDLG